MKGQGVITQKQVPEKAVKPKRITKGRVRCRYHRMRKQNPDVWFPSLSQFARLPPRRIKGNKNKGINVIRRLLFWFTSGPSCSGLLALDKRHTQRSMCIYVDCKLGPRAMARL